jgi:hypothetical protein
MKYFSIYWVFNEIHRKFYGCCRVEYVDLQKYNFICSKQRPGQLGNAETLYIILEIHVYQELNTHCYYCLQLHVKTYVMRYITDSFLEYLSFVLEFLFSSWKLKIILGDEVWLYETPIQIFEKGSNRSPGINRIKLRGASMGYNKFYGPSHSCKD